MSSIPIDVTFLGADRETILLPNRSFPGQAHLTASGGLPCNPSSVATSPTAAFSSITRTSSLQREADDLFAQLEGPHPLEAGDGLVRPAVPAPDRLLRRSGRQLHLFRRHASRVRPGPIISSISAGASRRRPDAPFNSLLLNYYRDGNDSIGYHTDAEPELGVDPIVPSLSLGAARQFVLRHVRTRERLTYDLTHGSLLVMAGTTQHHWRHAVPKTKTPVGKRINLTFRNILSAAREHPMESNDYLNQVVQEQARVEGELKNWRRRRRWGRRCQRP